ncbi:MAG: pirin family protein, partial [Pseudomonadota bacterium]
LDGALEHKDSLGNGSVVSAGGIQYMSAGSGVQHAEYNASHSAPVHFLQVWLLPDVTGEAPRYDTMTISDDEKAGKLKLFLSADGREGSMRIKNPADIYAATLDQSQVISFQLRQGRRGWIQVAKGELSVNDLPLSCGDGLAVTASGGLSLANGNNAEIILFDLEAL